MATEIDLEPPFSMIICASSGSGKTTLLRHMLTHTLGPGGSACIDNIFIMSDTADLSSDYDTFRAIPEYKGRIFGSYDKDVIEEIYEKQKYLKTKYGTERTPHTLLVLDDVMDHLQGNKTLVQKLFWKGRHVRLSVIILVQKLKGISTVMRVNAKYVIFFRCGNSSELENLLNEYTGKNERKKIEGVLVEHFKAPWSWLFCDLKTQDFTERYQLGVGNEIVGTIDWSPSPAFE